MRSFILLTALMMLNAELATATSQQTSSNDSQYGELLAKASKKKSKKKKKKSSGGDYSASAPSDGGSDGKFKQFGARLVGGYMNVSKLSDAVADVEEAGGTAEAGFGWLVGGTFSYFLNKDINIIGEFDYGSVTLSVSIPDGVGGEVVSEASYGVMYFGAGAGYVLDLGGMGVNVGGTVGYNINSVADSSAESDTEEAASESISGLAFSLFLNAYYAITPTIRVGIEPRFMYSMAAPEAAEDATEEEAAESESFGSVILVLGSVEFLF